MYIIVTLLHLCYFTDPPNEPVEMSSLELPRGQIGEILVSGWHVNTHQVTTQYIASASPSLALQKTWEQGYTIYCSLFMYFSYIIY